MCSSESMSFSYMISLEGGKTDQNRSGSIDNDDEKRRQERTYARRECFLLREEIYTTRVN